MADNEILAFCETSTGTNLLTEAEYLASSDRTSGNKPGVASAKLNNKALRQSAYIASQVAQYVSDETATDVLDDATPAKLLSQVKAALLRIAPKITTYTSSSGSHNLCYVFFIATGNATIGATYTNNAVTYTVVETVASGKRLRATGNGAPLVAGTLTKASGSGDSTITFYAVRAPLWLRAKMVGGGGGGSGSGSASQTSGGTGGNSTFGTTLLVANGGVGGDASSGNGGTGGSASLGTGPVGIALSGGSGEGGSLVSGTGGSASNLDAGGSGASSPFGGCGGGGGYNVAAGRAAIANSGSGGGGGGGNNAASVLAGPGGAAGGYVDAIITTVLSTYAYAIGAAGAAGASGTSGANGGAGGSGFIMVEENYQ